MTKPVAKIHLKSPQLMPQKMRQEVADWLRHHADCLLKEGDTYTDGPFHGTYNVPEKDLEYAHR